MLKTADNSLIKDVMIANPEFKELFKEHIQLEQDLEALLSLKFFPPEVEMKIKEIKKVKLRGKDRMEQILADFKNKTQN